MRNLSGVRSYLLVTGMDLKVFAWWLCLLLSCYPSASPLWTCHCFGRGRSQVMMVSLFAGMRRKSFFSVVDKGGIVLISPSVSPRWVQHHSGVAMVHVSLEAPIQHPSLLQRKGLTLQKIGVLSFFTLAGPGFELSQTLEMFVTRFTLWMELFLWVHFERFGLSAWSMLPSAAAFHGAVLVD